MAMTVVGGFYMSSWERVACMVFAYGLAQYKLNREASKHLTTE